MTKSARVSVRLEEEAQDAVEVFAQEERRSKSEVLRELLEEAIRLRRCPGILFVAGPTGRRPVIAGTGLEVWEVIATYQECAFNFPKLQEIYHWLTPAQLRSALAYYHLYPIEIDEEIQRQQAFTREEAGLRYPHLATSYPSTLPPSERRR